MPLTLPGQGDGSAFATLDDQVAAVPAAVDVFRQIVVSRWCRCAARAPQAGYLAALGPVWYERLLGFEQWRLFLLLGKLDTFVYQLTAG